MWYHQNCTAQLTVSPSLYGLLLPQSCPSGSLSTTVATRFVLYSSTLHKPNIFRYVQIFLSLGTCCAMASVNSTHLA